MSEVIFKGLMTENEFKSFERKLFDKLEEFIKTSSNDKEWLCSSEAKEYLGVGETKFYDLIGKGIIKQYDLDGTKRYNRKELFEALYHDSL